MSRSEMFKQIQVILHESYTDKGVADWWERRHPQLNNRTAYEAWYDYDHKSVYELALSLQAGSSV